MKRRSVPGVHPYDMARPAAGRIESNGHRRADKWMPGGAVTLLRTNQPDGFDPWLCPAG